MLARIKAPEIRNIPPIEFLPVGDKQSQQQETGWFGKVLESVVALAFYCGLSTHALLRYGFGSRYFTIHRIIASILFLLLFIFARNFYLAAAATWEGWAIEGNIINYTIGVFLVISLIASRGAFIALFLFWLGYMVFIAGHNPLTLLIEAVDGFFSYPTLAAVVVLVGAMVLHRSFANHWEKTTPEDKHIHSHYYGRSVFWHIYPNDTVNTLLMEPVLLLGVYFIVRTIAPELAFYVAVLGSSAFILSLYAWRVSHRYRQNRTDGKRYSTDQLNGTEQPPTEQKNGESIQVAGMKKHP